MNKPLDIAQRLEALDIRQSFIVQAPAGSGKTSLLTQRFLRLLATVKNPEEILAITFTNKAAAEMHQRIIESLKLAQHPRPADEFNGQTWDIASQVLQHDAESEWHLLQNPNRLRVQTIDSLCASLTRQLPVTARFGSTPAVLPDATPLYLEAARNCLEELDDQGDVAEAIKILLSQVDNQISRAESLLSAMLASRDQWLRHIINEQTDNRYVLEDVLQRSIESVLMLVSSAIDESQKKQLNDLLNYASGYIADTNSSICQHGQEVDLNDTGASSVDAWRMLVNFLLTSDGSWRKQANAAMGFPAPSGTKDKLEKTLFDEKKKQYRALLDELTENEPLLDALGWIRCLPSAHYSEQQWQFIQALYVVLPRAVGHLRLVFQQRGEVDFCEVSLSASHALHDVSGVTDVGLKLDYQLQHILLDEFQDTSETQFMLMKDLVAGWQPDDGRTLFLVGDPMQSIYRFRQAEVGLFLKTQQEGLGEVRNIKPLTISVNFRSQAGVVDWVNRVFERVMPEQDNLYSGAISYKSSQSFKDDLLAEQSVCYYAHEDRQAEGQLLCELIQRIKKERPDESIGVLVRGRKSLADLVVALNDAGVAYQATDIDPLNKRQTVIDLMSLTRAYLQAADRVAWLSILRAPWCGLSLSDMHALLEDCPEANVWDLLQQEARLLALSEAGQLSLRRLINALTVAFNHRERLSVAEIIAGLWSELLGPECLSSVAELNDAQRYFECLKELDGAGQSLDLKVLNERVEKLYAAADVSAPDGLQIMTIHKAKGLEFDHVILPGLDRKSANDDKRLLAWLERPSEMEGESELLIAPLKESGGDANEPISQYLNKIEQQKSLHESQRLLYVAATRAKKQLHLSFCLKIDEKTEEIKTPSSNTLLGMLWPYIQQDVSFNKGDSLDKKDSITNCNISRLNIEKIEKPDIKSLDFKQLGTEKFRQQTNLVEFDWATDTAAAIGTVCHQMMQILGEKGASETNDKALSSSEKFIPHLLLEAGVLPRVIDDSIQRVKQILTNCLQDKRGQWVLNKGHEASEFEFALSGVIDNEIIHCRLDRTFVTEGQRWIIDYKTSRHDDDNKEQFLQTEVSRYKAQLEQYAQLMGAIDPRPIMLGLYYPAFGGWRSWEFKRAEK